MPSPLVFDIPVSVRESMSVIQHLCREDLWPVTGYSGTTPAIDSPLRLHCNENPWPPGGCDDLFINRYPEQQPARLAERMAELYGVTPAHLVVTRGADDGIDILIRGFCRPGVDRVTQCPPAFVMYAFFARLHGASVINVPLASANFQVDFAAVRETADQGSRVIFLCSPNNPTGSLLPAKETLQLAEQLGDRALVVVDEAYQEFSGVAGLTASVDQHPNLIVLRTLSKAWSLAGARIGGLVAHPDVVAYLLRSVVPPYPLSQQGVSTALQALDPRHEDVARARIGEVLVQRKRMELALPKWRFVKRVFPGNANFLLVAVENSRRLLEFCRSHGILIRDQSGQPGLENHVRITIGSGAEMDRLLETLSRFEDLR
jgi:histidinol-phosphate aminotransferase